MRDQFNATQAPYLLLFLLLRCVKAAVRYNAEGAFNQSPDNRRKGTKPVTVRKQLLRTASLLQGRVHLSAVDYREVLSNATPSDLVYLDPPYQGVSKRRDPRYYSQICHTDFIAALEALLRRDVPFMVSYDGRTGSQIYGVDLPEALGLTRFEIAAGRSSQATLLGKSAQTVEALYLSPQLVKTPLQQPQAS